MPRDGAIIFADLIGKLDVFYGSLARSANAMAVYGLNRLIERRGRDAKLIDWLDELTADCAKKRAGNMNDPCSARLADIPGRQNNVRFTPESRH